MVTQHKDGVAFRVVASQNLALSLAGRPSEDVQATFCAVLVAQWAQLGVRQAVLAPGSRSTPMALALLAHPEITVHVFHDERSAAFAALGIGLADERPAILLCTSGTAVAHFHAAVIEADLSHVPILVLTADRPAELRDVGAPQTVSQTHIFGNSVRWFHDPGVAEIASCDSWSPLAHHSFVACCGVNAGPVHINLPFREPLTGSAVEFEPQDHQRFHVAHHPRIAESDLQALADTMKTSRGVIVAGRGCGDPASVAELAQATGWPILADSRSGCQGLPDAILHFDSLIREPNFAKMHQPELVLRLGEAPSSKVLAQWLTASGARQIHVSSYQTVFDPDQRVVSNITCEVSYFCATLAKSFEMSPASHVKTDWITRDHQARRAIEQMHRDENSLTASAVSRQLIAALAPGSNLVLSSSMPIRDMEWFGGDCSHVRVFSNRGANGIDGVLATAIGVAVATGHPTAVLMGDVAFVHDSSSLIALKRRDLNLKILVTDNDGGGIFHYLPQATLLAPDVFETLFGTPHDTNIAQLAQAHGLPAFEVTSSAELETALSTPGCAVIVVKTDRHNEVQHHRLLHEAVHSALSL